MANINKIPLPEKIKIKLKELGLDEKDIDNENAIHVALYQQALKGNVSAINQILKLFETEETTEDRNFDITKEVKKEEKKFKKILENLPENQKKANYDFIHQLAFQSVTLKHLSEDIAKNGVKEKYKNGNNQWGYKDRTEVKTYNNMFKNYQSAMKQLNDLLINNNIEPDDDFDSFGSNDN